MRITSLISAILHACSYEPAIALLLEVIQSSPNLPDPYHTLGLLYEQVCSNCWSHEHASDCRCKLVVSHWVSQVSRRFIALCPCHNSIHASAKMLAGYCDPFETSVLPGFRHAAVACTAYSALVQCLANGALIYAALQMAEPLHVRPFVSSNPDRTALPEWLRSQACYSPRQTECCLHVQVGEPRKALDFYMIAAHLTPKDISLWHRLATLSAELGFVRQAIYCLGKVGPIP